MSGYFNKHTKILYDTTQNWCLLGPSAQILNEMKEETKRVILIENSALPSGLRDQSKELVLSDTQHNNYLFCSADNVMKK